MKPANLPSSNGHLPLQPPSPRPHSAFFPSSAPLRMYSVVLSIGAASMFLVSLDSVVDNLLPVAEPYLVGLYGSKDRADLAWEWVVSSRIYGLAAGCLLAALLSNRPSRREPLLQSALLSLFGAALTLLITRFGRWGIVVGCVGRFLGGAGTGLAQVVGSAMLAEIPPLRSRGRVLATLTVWSCLGELTGMVISLETVMGRESCWNWALIAPTALIPLTMLVIFAAPDSPRALLVAGEEGDAIAALRFYQGDTEWAQSLADIRAEFKAGSLHTPSYHRLSASSFTRPLMLGAFVLTFTHLDDWLWISYSTQVFENVGMATPLAQLSSLLMSIPQALVSLCLLYCFDVFSRRQLLIAPTLASIALSLAAMGVLCGGVPATMILLPVLASLDLSAAAVASESAYTVVPELFTQRDRVLGPALIGIAQNAFGGLLTTFILSVVNAYGAHYVLAPLMLINVVYVAVIYGWLPETGGKSFQAISLRFQQDDGLPCFTAAQSVLKLPKASVKRFVKTSMALSRTEKSPQRRRKFRERLKRFGQLAVNLPLLLAPLLLLIMCLHMMLKIVIAMSVADK